MRVGGLVEEVKGVGKRIGRVRLKVEGLRLLGGLGVKSEFVGERKGKPSQGVGVYICDGRPFRLPFSALECSWPRLNRLPRPGLRSLGMIKPYRLCHHHLICDWPGPTSSYW